MEFIGYNTNEINEFPFLVFVSVQSCFGYKTYQKLLQFEFNIRYRQFNIRYRQMKLLRFSIL